LSLAVALEVTYSEQHLLFDKVWCAGKVRLGCSTDCECWRGELAVYFSKIVVLWNKHDMILGGLGM